MLEVYQIVGILLISAAKKFFFIKKYRLANAELTGLLSHAPPVVLSLAIRLLTQLAQEFLAVQSHFTVSLLSVVLCY